MNKYSVLIIGGLLYAPFNSYASNALGDANDESSIYMWGGGGISANFKDKSAKVSYLYSKSDKPLSLGVTLKGKSTNDASVIFDGDKVTPETTISIPIGYHWLFSEKPGRQEPTGFIRDDWFFLEVKYTSGEYQMFDSSRVFNGQLYKEKMQAPALALSYNAITSYNVLFGTSLEYGKTNNYTDLKKKEVKTTTDVDTSGSSARVTESSVTAREGVYKEFNQTKFNIDAMIIPEYFESRIGLDLFARYTNSSEQESSYVNTGLGVFLLKDGAPTKIVGGITFMRDDKKNENVVGIVAGYNY